MYPGIHAQSTPDKPAYVMGGTGETVTFAELDAAANRLAQLFAALDLEVGDHIAFCLENHPRFYELAWGGPTPG